MANDRNSFERSNEGFLEEMESLGALHLIMGDESSSEEVAAVIDIDEFEKAKKDPKTKDFLSEAERYGHRLQTEGRDGSI